MQAEITAPDIVLAMIFANPAVQIFVALLGPAALLVLQIYFRTGGKQIARNADAAFQSDPQLASAWRDLEREYTTLFETYSRGRSRDLFRVNRKSDWRFDQRRHVAADANRDMDALFTRFHQTQRVARIRFAIWKWHVAGAHATTVAALAYIATLLVLLLAIGNAAFAVSGALAIAITAAVWIAHGLLLTPGNQRRIVNADITWETLAHAYEASESGAEF
jgi:ABC-type multidrug transport system fused ATPase/permease subunit